MKLDELNIIDNKIELLALPFASKKEAEDSLLDLLVMSYMFGNDVGAKMLGLQPYINETKMFNAIDFKIKGITAFDRLENSLKSENRGSVEEQKRIFETESHRVFNQSLFDYGTEHKANKVWRTMEDELVRDTHFYLDGVVKPLDEPFYTYDGDYGMFPCDFKEAYNNVNCRCYIELV